ncbi:hypothetical protein [Chitinophaga cymbidii]|uniref:Uncharacterized protein n=1 Tax=Chitinophaga cymbidii TaxID=1096750 RepID=A0A512RIQ4_9BACT|nr:hypothetical protein [Chitinophaga cymbidii]GEP95567.1 hypothetical protein CCY01nite_18270 [Chitinophaga cymbidii]
MKKSHKEAFEKVVSSIRKSIFGKEKFESGKLSDGTTIEYSSLEAGAEISVTDAEGNATPAPVGEYELEDGRIVVVSEVGKIAEIKEAAPEEGGQKPEEMAEDEKPAAPAGGGLDWSQQIEDLKRSLAWQAERVASLVTAINMFKADAREVFEAFQEYIEVDSASSQGGAITKPKQTVFGEIKEKRAESRERVLTKFKAFNVKHKINKTA